MIFRQLRGPFLALITLCLVTALMSCSKKDVEMDESGEFGSAEAVDSGGFMEETTTTTMETGIDEMGAGDIGAPAADLSRVFYEFDSFRLSQDSREALKGNASWLQDNPSSTIQIEGHCDGRGTAEYNLALGERRANAAMDYLINLGVDSSRLSIISYGEERPLDPSTNESSWAQNRRSEFIVLSR